MIGPAAPSPAAEITAQAEVAPSPATALAHARRVVVKIGSSLLVDAMTRAVAQAGEQGHLLASADPRQISFEIHALILALHYEARFMRRPGSMERAVQGFHNILARYGA